MKYDDLTIQKLRELPIFDVCSKLGITLYGMGKLTKRATCWYHDDKHPSMHVNKKKNIYKCFVCGIGGDVLKLVQDYENLTFPEACDWLIHEFSVSVLPDAQPPMNHGDWHNDSSQVGTTCGDQGACPRDSSGSSRAVPSSLYPLPSSLVDRSLSVDSEFCRSLVSNGYLTTSQMRSAASRYRLGATKEGGVIFWEIDAQNRVHTGKIMYYQSDCHRDKTHTPTWVHALIKEKLPQDYELQHCLFGLHLINTHPDPLMGRGYLSERATGGAVKPPHIAIVESEKTAVIMSEIIPEFIWLSCGGLQMFKPELLSPLTDHKVILFPDTDESGEAFTIWTQIAQQASKLYSFKHPLRISNLLESAASLDQKQRKIDIVDFLFEL